ncbi:MAG: translation initiation factor IF-2 N-terminal domain-containing protein, partial [Vagococcus sp.]
MSKKRVYELAKELEMSSKNIVDKAHSIGIDVKNHMSTLADSDITKIKNEIGKHKAPKQEVKKATTHSTKVENKPNSK